MSRHISLLDPLHQIVRPTDEMYLEPSCKPMDHCSSLRVDIERDHEVLQIFDSDAGEVNHVSDRLGRNTKEVHPYCTDGG